MTGSAIQRITSDTTVDQDPSFRALAAGLNGGAALQLPLADDLIWGVEGIAAEINQTVRATHNLISTRKIPVGKLGNKLFASRALLRAHFAALLSAAE